ncbi:alkaline phosphatase D family protein [Variovorax sp. J22R115]|uniref:alkaline phosphatase D family protein n=1 Tax=Variovorax sp. J22R115 TaxID=3053509 RepID=UPI002578B6D2|nr:alkaline phosphatase D family protein [Variovorax sp. J22R115]MDM0052990.1 alkaline phosphatase D family protein [Variovorax sp. J22R115]
MKIAFASCCNLKLYPEQPIWDEIASEAPDYLFLLGDQIYMDFFPNLEKPKDWPVAKFRTEMADRYEKQWREKHFAALVETVRGKGGVHGTWDDHDFAWNDACGMHVQQAKKDVARQFFCKYMGVVPRGEGIFHVVPLFDGGTKLAKAIFVDTRWYRDLEGDHNDLLGEEQFEFLQQELNADAGLLTIVCAGTPMRATGKGWHAYKRDHQRFMQMVGDRKVIFLSGDIHENLFIPPSSGTHLYEIISSGVAVKKLGIIGSRHNFGLLDWRPDNRIKVTLRDKRGRVVYLINNNATFDHQEFD